MVNPHRLPRQSGQRVEAFRQQRETENVKSLLVKLPAELHNKIYGLALPHGRVFNTGSATNIEYFDPDSTSKIRCAILRTRKSYRRHFTITQVCRPVRSDTVKLLYSTNTFLLSTVSSNKHDPPTRAEIIGDATAWIMSRPPEALQAISRIVLQHWDISDEHAFRGTMLTLFDLEKRTTKHLKLRPNSYAYNYDVHTYITSYTGVNFKKVFRAAEKMDMQQDRGRWLRTLVEAFSREIKRYRYPKHLDW